ncbi:MAG: TonB C-terminal domain-containing protein [Burkholderiales bacterium]|nr:TonB C-terminal domain-containing protein [Burkholderiales bacterium]
MKKLFLYLLLGYTNANADCVMLCKDQKYTLAYPECLKEAEAGDIDAMYNVGHLYNDGNGVTQDHTQAYTWWLKAANQGNVKAMYNVGHLYYDGNGVDQDYTKSCNWMTKAANKGFANAKKAKKIICALAKKPLMSKRDCMKQSIYNINHDNINLGYKLDQRGRNYYYIYSIGQCQAIDDYKNGVGMSDQVSFHKVAFPNSKEKPVNTLIGKIYTSEVASIAWNGYANEYFRLKIQDPKQHQFNSNESNNYADLIINTVKPFVVIPEDVDVRASATIRVEFNPTLDIKSVKLTKSSGNSSYDKNIESAIWAVKKFPPLPNGANFVDYRVIQLTFRPQ